MKPHCPQCKKKTLYTLSDKRLECATCHYRFSPRKQQINQNILEGFLAELSPKKCADKYQLSFPTVFNRYSLLRQLLTLYLERSYQEKEYTFSEYEEYIFLPRSKRNNPKYLLEGIGIMGMNRNNYIYTLLMPDHFNTYKNQYLEDGIDHIALEELSHYIHWKKIAKLSSFDTPLTRFWLFLENFMRAFRGIKREYFSEYLKEAEFRFNYTQKEQKNILWKLWEEYETAHR